MLFINLLIGFKNNFDKRIYKLVETCLIVQYLWKVSSRLYSIIRSKHSVIMT